MASISSQMSFQSLESKTMSMISDDVSYADNSSQHSFESTGTRISRISVSRRFFFLDGAPFKLSIDHYHRLSYNLMCYKSCDSFSVIHFPLQTMSLRYKWVTHWEFIAFAISFACKIGNFFQMSQCTRSNRKYTYFNTFSLL